MSTDGFPKKYLSQVPQRELRELLHALKAGWVSPPYTEVALRQTSLEAKHVAPLVELLESCSPQGAQNLLQAVIAERLHRPPPRLELVWTGPETRDFVARDTAVVVRQLFERATRTVIIGGFRFDHGESLLHPLHVGMQQGLTVTMFVGFEGHAATLEGGPAYAQHAIDELMLENWPFGPPYPDVYYDPRTAVPGPPWASMHAKCIVVDEEWAFVTSANFTDRGQTRNLEVGVCIEDRSFARQLAAQWRGLIASDLVVPYR